MKKALLVALIIVILTGCESKKSNDYLDVFDFIDTEKKPEIFPETMVDGGEAIYGNGKEDETDILSQIEKAIWGEE